MLVTTLGILAALVLPQTDTDTTVTIRPGGRLELDNFEGRVEITTWSRNAVRIQATPEDRSDVEVESDGAVVHISSSGRRGPGTVNYRITVPAAIDVTVSGHGGDVRIDGPTGEISVETIEGNIAVRGGGRLVALHSVEGDITLSGARGRIELNSVDGAIKVTGVSGELVAQTVDGEIDLQDIESGSVEATTVDGDVAFRGTLKDAGRYRLNTHDGDVTVTVPQVNATVSVSTFSGDFDSDFPLVLNNTRGSRRFTFTLGSGSARLELESFDGSIALRRSGATKR
jgi:DUF4097 and DUF4098 domain-containing protein YvlB